MPINRIPALAVVFPFRYEAGVNFPEIRYQLSIGEYAIISAGAVVTRSIPAKCTAVGVLAKVGKIKDGEANLV